MSIKWIVAILVLLWFIGFIQIPFLNTPLFVIFGQAFTIHHLLFLLLFGYIIRLLPPMLQMVVTFLLALWLLSIFVFPAIGGLGNIVIIVIILFVIFSIL